MKRWCVVLSILVAACGEKSRSGSPSPSATATVAPAPSGMASPDNQPAVVALAKQVLVCEWQTVGPKSTECAPYKQWLEGAMFARGAADATLIAFVEDPDRKVRLLGAGALARHGKTYATARPLAERLLTALQKETDEPIAVRLGEVVAKSDLAKTKLVEPVLEQVEKHPLPAVRQRMLERILFRNRTNKPVYDHVVKTASAHADSEHRKAALKGLWLGTPTGKGAATCALYAKRAMGDPSPEVAEHALMLGLQFPIAPCSDQWGPLLDHAGELAREGGLRGREVPVGLGALERQKAATDELKAKAKEVAKAILDHETNGGAARAGALRFLADVAPDDAKTRAEGLKDDPNPTVKIMATQLLERAKAPNDEEKQKEP